MKKFLMIAALAAAPAALADAPAYQYLEASIQMGDMEFSGLFSGQTDAEGFAYRGSFEINDSWFAQIDAMDFGTSGDAQIGASHINSLSFGWHNDMFFARLGYEWATGPELFIPAEGSGYLLDVGVRTLVTDSLELSAHYGMADAGAGFGASTMYGVAAAYMFSETMAFTVNYDQRSISDYAELLIGPGMDVDATHYGVGFRWTFGD